MFFVLNYKVLHIFYFSFFSFDSNDTHCEVFGPVWKLLVSNMKFTVIIILKNREGSFFLVIHIFAACNQNNF